ncbi:MAG TPA: helix-turn-helix domain-containing protein [Burkholderiales bacterium]
MIPAVAIPAFIALICKLGLLGYSIRVPTKNLTMRLVQALLVVFVLHNLAELVMLSHFTGEVTRMMEYLGFVYFALIIPVVTLILHVSVRLSFDLLSNDKRRKLELLLYLPAVVLLYLLLATDQLVAGFQTFRNTLLRIPGPLYVLFEVYLPGYLLASLASLVYGARGSRKSAIRRARNRLWLLALFPLAVLVWYLIIANHYGLAKITSTIYLPIPWMLFLLGATYVTHHYRLFDVAFFVPGSKIRRRKKAFYNRIQGMIGGIANVQSTEILLGKLANIFHCPVALIDGPLSAIAVEGDQERSGENELLLSQFPREVLEKVDQIIVAEEIAESDPELHSLMKHYNVGAIVPFNSHSAASSQWMLLGERFSDEVYTPLDFKHLEKLFERVGEHLSENLLPLRTQLEDVTQKIRELKQRLATSWNELSTVRKNVDLARAENFRLRDSNGPSLDYPNASKSQLPAPITSKEKTLEQYLVGREIEIIGAALKRCRGNTSEAARLLGMSPRMFLFRLKYHGLDP